MANIPLGTVSVNAAGLTPGLYVGLVQVTADSANNSPQFLRVDLQVLPRGRSLGTVVRPAGLVFVVSEGSSAAASQEVTLTTAEATPVDFVTQPVGGDWLRRLPESGVVTRDNPVRIAVRPQSASLAPGIYRAGLTIFTRNDASIYPVSALLVVVPRGAAPASSSGYAQAAAQDCAATQLLMQFTTIFTNFSATVGYPTVVQVKAVDNCGNAAVGGSMTLSFSNGDPAVSLSDLRNGQYAGTWRPSSTSSSQVVLTAQGSWRGLQGQLRASARIGANPNPQSALLNQGGILLGAGFEPGPLAPGSIISLFGQSLTSSTNVAGSLPLPRTLSGLRVLIAGREAPLFYAGPTQVNAQLPFELEADRQLQVLVESNGTPSAPEMIQTAGNRPGIFTLGPPFGSQGAILINNTNRLAMPTTPNIPSEPIPIGGIVSIFCTGLGATDPPVNSGEAASLTRLAPVKTAVTVTIGGQPAEVSFAGLAPGLVGVYQVNAKVPDGITTGDTVPVALTQQNFRSNTATIAVR